ncbi:PIN domain-containing protein [Rhodopseudomonas sp. BR0M22]|uniref:PIN domain-containing protein n=1 Tax=Rhodopseudomonas sp. BR0M22 TaxID=2269369 RepID=UPI0013E0C524|nr:PIN domain-containing protein [Rhodopseudomonas sp. BR0M22]MCD0415857.1 PIN domain-containing protein [Rubrivivax sp. JA1024]
MRSLLCDDRDGGGDRGISGLPFAALTPDVLVASSFLPSFPHRDPADRIIAATAREYGYRLITRDRSLLAYAREGHIQALSC